LANGGAANGAVHTGHGPGSTSDVIVSRPASENPAAVTASDVQRPASQSPQAAAPAVFVSREATGVYTLRPAESAPPPGPQSAPPVTPSASPPAGLAAAERPVLPTPSVPSTTSTPSGADQ
jgi:hypothetical protein